MQPKPPDESDWVAAINESAQHVAALTLTFLAVCVHVGVAVASTRTLDISNAAIHDLRQLPRHLEVLTLSQGQVDRLEGLPDTVRALHIVDSLGESLH